MSNDLIQTTPKPTREQVSLPLGLSVFVLLLVALIYSWYALKGWLADEQAMPIQAIIFTGELKAIDTQSLEQTLRARFKQSFFTVDVNDVHAMLEQQPWIYSASIRKRWPNSLYVHIVEQQAVAVWNANTLLNKYGETFEGEIDALMLPQIYGPQGSEKTALVGYNQMRSLLRQSQIGIASVSLSKRFAWELVLDNGVRLNLGRQEYINRLQRFIDFYPQIAALDRPIEYVDLRYDTGMAVGWLIANTEQTE